MPLKHDDNQKELAVMAVSATYVSGFISGPDTVVCAGQPATFTAFGSSGVPPYYYIWSSNGGNTLDTIYNDSTFTFYPQSSDSVFCYVVDSCGIVSEQTNPVTVNVNPSVSLNPFDSVNASAPAFTLTGGSPPGGRYSGAGVSAGMFNPAIAGPGTHIITYTYSSSGCTGSAQANIVVTNYTGLVVNTGNSSIQLYPNPTSGRVNLVIDHVQAEAVTVQITNELGQEIKTEQYIPGASFAKTYDMSALASGLYYFKVIVGEKVQVIGVTVVK